VTRRDQDWIYSCKLTATPAQAAKRQRRMPGKLSKEQLHSIILREFEEVNGKLILGLYVVAQIVRLVEQRDARDAALEGRSPHLQHRPDGG